jgi:hypothetical protein
MAALDPAIHVFLHRTSQDVDARDEPGHDGAGAATGVSLPSVRLLSSACAVADARTIAVIRMNLRIVVPPLLGAETMRRWRIVM